MGTPLNFVAIDVEPGGRSKMTGDIGIAECVDGQVDAGFQIQFESPHFVTHPPIDDYYTPPPPPPDTTRFTAVEALQFVDAFVGDRPVVFFHAPYDVGALRRLTADAERPRWGYLCAARLAREATSSREYSLIDWVLRLGLLSEAEVARRRELHRSQGSHAQKWLLHNAADDAWAAALLCASFSDQFSATTLKQL